MYTFIVIIVLHFRPLTLSENLAKTAQKIDFNKTNTSTSDTDDINDDQAGEDGENYNKQDSKESSQTSLLPFDSIRTKLKYVSSLSFLKKFFFIY